MTPNNIVHMAQLLELNIIALTDHNSCGNCAAVCEAAAGTDLTVLPGMELCTAEEAHIVCLFPTLEPAAAFEKIVAPTRPAILNRPDIFGEQLLMDAADQPTGREEVLLTTASSISVEEVLPLVRSFGGTAFPAHIDRPSYSVTASLGDIPPVGFAAIEITAAGDLPSLLAQYPAIQGLPLLQNSDAHYLHMMQERGPWLELPDRSAETILAALDGRLACRWGRA